MSSLVKWFYRVFKKKKVTTSNIGVTARFNDDDEDSLTRPHTAISLVAMANLPTATPPRPRSAPVPSARKSHQPKRKRRNSYGYKAAETQQRYPAVDMEMCPCCLRKRELYRAGGHFRPYVLWANMNHHHHKIKRNRSRQKHICHGRHTTPQINRLGDLSKTYGPGRPKSPVHKELLGPYAQFPQYNVNMAGRNGHSTQYARNHSADGEIFSEADIELISTKGTKGKHPKDKQRQTTGPESIRLAWSNKVQGETPYDITNLMEIHKQWPKIIKKPVQQLPKKPPFRF